MNIWVFGGTTESLELCTKLTRLGLDFYLSVATDTGAQVAQNFRHQLRIGRLNAQEMAHQYRELGITHVIDAAHPFADRLRQEILDSCRSHSLLGHSISCLRLERPSDLNAITHPKLFRVKTIDQACELAQKLGKRIFLTTGSKELALYLQRIPSENVIVRVLPTPTVLEQCVELGLQLDQMYAMKGPFCADLNRELYRFTQADVVITKESGNQGGFIEKVRPCLDLSLTCIVIERPLNLNSTYYQFVADNSESLSLYMQELATKEMDHEKSTISC